jgi:hypothetical protein
MKKKWQSFKHKHQDIKFWIENSVIKHDLYLLLLVLLFTLYTSFLNCIYIHSTVEDKSRWILF